MDLLVVRGLQFRLGLSTVPFKLRFVLTPFIVMATANQGCGSAFDWFLNRPHYVNCNYTREEG